MNPTRFSLGTLVLAVLGLMMGRLFLHHRTLGARTQPYDDAVTNFQEHTPADFEEAKIQAEIQTLRLRRASVVAATPIVPVTSPIAPTATASVRQAN